MTIDSTTHITLPPGTWPAFIEPEPDVFVPLEECTVADVRAALRLVEASEDVRHYRELRKLLRKL